MPQVSAHIISVAHWWFLAAFVSLQSAAPQHSVFLSVLLFSNLSLPKSLRFLHLMLDLSRLTIIPDFFLVLFNQLYFRSLEPHNSMSTEVPVSPGLQIISLFQSLTQSLVLWFFCTLLCFQAVVLLPWHSVLSPSHPNQSTQGL